MNRPEDFDATSPSLTVVFCALLRRDLRLYARHRGVWLNPLLFALMVILLLVLGIGPEPSLLRDSAAGIIWVVALLGMMLSLELLFRSDFDDGSLEQLLLCGDSLYLAVSGKILAHWLITGVPMMLASPLFCLLLDLPQSVVPALALSLLLGSGSLSFLGAIAAALTVSLRGGGLLLALLILPLYIPVIIFGSQFIDSVIHGGPTLATLSMLLGLLLAAASLAPLAVIGGMRISVEN